MAAWGVLGWPVSSHKWVVDCRKRAELNPTPVQADDKAPADHASLRLNGYAPSSRDGQPRQRPQRTRRHITRPQRVAAALIAAACVFGAVWYVPRIAAADGNSLSGTVTSSGVVYLNFSSSGQLGSITATIGQRVDKGQLLATEVAPATAAVLAADRAAITADKSELAAALSGGSASATDAARAQLARDKGQLAIDRAEAAGTRIVAPADGTVIAVNGQPGETADADGMRDYEAPGTSATQRPLFSLLPEGPQSGDTADGSDSGAYLPVIALRTSGTWQVSVLVPEGSIGDVRTGQLVSVDVPAAGLTGVPGRVQELLTTPVATSQGLGYLAVVNVLDQRQISPPSGVAANVQLGS
jgi:multidrug efflux pump subunit AcrA (membrane-fusion protein)